MEALFSNKIVFFLLLLSSPGSCSQYLDLASEYQTTMTSSSQIAPSSHYPHPHKNFRSYICDYLDSLQRAIQTGDLVAQYSHQNLWRTKRAAGGESETTSVRLEANCYGFVSMVLSRLYPRAYQEVLSAMTQMAPDIPESFDLLPTPFHYAKAVERFLLPSWEEIPTLDRCAPGDLLIYFPDGYSLRRTPSLHKEKTGTHIMFVKSYEGLNGDYHHIKVIDCTEKPHSRQHDSRWIGKGSKGGVGESSVFIKPDPEPEPLHRRASLRWSLLSKRQHTKVIYILRVGVSE